MRMQDYYHSFGDQIFLIPFLFLQIILSRRIQRQLFLPTAFPGRCKETVLLIKCPHTKHVNLLFCQVTPFTARQFFLGQSGKIYPIEFHHPIT